MATPSFNPAKRSLGQNFLIDEDVIDRIVASLDAISGERVVEIGPGRGALTHRLLSGDAKLTVIEKDTALAEEWRRTNLVTVIESDFLDLDVARLETPARLIGNLPYNVSTAILERVAGTRTLFPEIVFMFQREVADRIVAKASTKDRGFLSVISQAAFDIERLFDVPPDAFQPRPKVWSTVIKLRPKEASSSDEPAFRRLVSLGFRQKRKMLSNNLKSEISNLEHSLEIAHIDGRRRAEDLSLSEWQRLHETVEALRKSA